MPKLDLLCALAVVGLLSGPSYPVFAASNKTTSKPSAQTTDHATRTSKPPKASATTGKTTSQRTANGQHIPETTVQTRKVKEDDRDLTCLLFPSLCFPPKH